MLLMFSSILFQCMQIRLLWLRTVVREGNCLICFFLVYFILLFLAKRSIMKNGYFSQPSEHNTYADIEAVYKCLEENYGAKQEDIILYGQSVGSGPTLDLAARLPRLRAVVLHSPILSGLRVMYPVKRTYWFDIYKVRFFSILCI